ncbi:TIGR01244 family sulfur transferase [soil metagenome]
MSDFRRVTDDFSVAPQITVEDVTMAAELGFTLLINNRPDGEAPDQTVGAEIEAAARALGLDYLHIPVSGGPRVDQAEAFQAALVQADGPVLAFCRSGTRSINTWALGQALAGCDRGGLIVAGASAGYDLRALLG